MNIIESFLIPTTLIIPTTFSLTISNSTYGNYNHKHKQRTLQVSYKRTRLLSFNKILVSDVESQTPGSSTKISVHLPSDFAFSQKKELIPTDGVTPVNNVQMVI